MVVNEWMSILDLEIQNTSFGHDCQGDFAIYTIRQTQLFLGKLYDLGKYRASLALFAIQIFMAIEDH